MLKKLFVAVSVLAFVGMIGTRVFAEGLTPQMCKDKALAAAKLIEAEGDAALSKIKDEKGEFRFAEGQGYIWVHNLEGKMIMHPIKPALDGTDINGTTDPNGFALFVAMNSLVKEKKSGWVPYMWPKPGQPQPAPKVSFVTLVQKDGKSYVVGSGIYNVTAEDIKKQFPGDAIFEE